MKTLINVTKVQLDFSDNVVDDDLITANLAYRTAEFSNLASQAILTILKALLPGLNQSNVSNHLVPNWARVEHSRFHVLFEPLEPRTDVINASLKFPKTPFQVLNRD
jgi:hypothetical protein